MLETVGHKHVGSTEDESPFNDAKGCVIRVRVEETLEYLVVRVVITEHQNVLVTDLAVF